MNIIFQVQGPGIDKSIVATAICRVIRNKWKDANLIVVSDYPDIFLHNPFVHRVFHPSELRYFYRDFVEGKSVKFICHDPAKETAYLAGECGLIEAWCRMLRVQYEGQLPEIYLMKREVDFLLNKIGAEKPVFAVQTKHSIYGAKPPGESYYNLPDNLLQPLIDVACREYKVVHVCHGEETQLQNSIKFVGSVREVAALIAISNKQLLIDDYCQHISAAVQKQSVVCWLTPMIKRRGYDLHRNISYMVPGEIADWTNIVFSKEHEMLEKTDAHPGFPSQTINKNIILNELKGNNIHQEICSRIVADSVNNSMVAKRLQHLLGHISFQNVRHILDIGSWHLGQSIEFANIFPEARIDAFEPVPESFNLCGRRWSELPSDMKERISIYNIALGEQIGEIPFYPIVAELSSVPNVGASSMFRFKEGLNGTPFGQNLVQEEIFVNSTTLDTWCKKNDVLFIDILWMDVQGAELLVLKGGMEILRKTKVIMTEVGLKAYYDGHTLKADIDKILFELGFIELTSAYEVNVKDYEANVIYLNTKI